MSATSSDATGRCQFAENPDAVTGCDCDCALARPKGRGLWATVKRLFTPYACTTGPGGSGTGQLPCRRFDEWRRRNG